MRNAILSPPCRMCTRRVEGKKCIDHQVSSLLLLLLLLSKERGKGSLSSFEILIPSLSTSERFCCLSVFTLAHPRHTIEYVRYCPLRPSLPHRSTLLRAKGEREKEKARVAYCVIDLSIHHGVISFLCGVVDRSISLGLMSSTKDR